MVDQGRNCWLFLLVLCICLSLRGYFCAKILLVPAQHRANIRELALLSEDLVLNGHQVFIVVGSTYTETRMLQDLGIQVLDFHVHRYQPMLYSPEVASEISDSLFRHKAEDDILTSMSEIALHGCELLMKDQSLLAELRRLHFDIAIVDAFPLAPCSAIVPHHLGIPFITKDPSPTAVHQPVFPSFIPSSKLPFTDRMSFWQRVVNVVYVMLDLYSYTYPGLQDVSLLSQFSTCFTDWHELLRQGSLHLSTRDHHLSYPLPVLPNHIQLPGVTWRSARPLTNPLFRFLDVAPEGAVVISLGTNIKTLPAEYLQKMVTAFQNFSSLVFIMKLDQQGILNIDVPNNVMSLPWLPLNDLLGHPRTRLFITHCGRSVLHEAVFHGVPVLALPVLGEDTANARRIEHLGLGRHLDLFNLTPDQLADALQELLKNKLYRENAGKVSAMLKAQKFNPTETVAFWVEHVLKFGAGHLRSEAMNLSSVQFSMLDVGLAFFAAFTCVFWFCYAYTMFLVNIVWKPKKKNKYCDRC